MDSVLKNNFYAVITTTILLDGSLDLIQIKCVRGMVQVVLAYLKLFLHHLVRAWKVRERFFAA